MTQSAPPAADGRPAPAPEQVRGPVEAVNEKGVRVAGQWCNYSRYAEVPRPEVGQWVELQVKNRFIIGLTLLGPNGANPLPAEAGPALPPTRPLRRRGPSPEYAEPPWAPDDPAPRPTAGWTAAVPDARARREQVISRLAVLKAAADFLARRPEAVADDVLAVAIQWLVWVEEDDRAPAA